ncbi:MAG: signal recognition particle-docking protein FtsY [Gemmatimonadaceae bacterium]|nr:signal recognition particle-docking protein FtsY [Gemmatimonadaceae bacterium]
MARLFKSGASPRRSLWQKLKDVALADVGAMLRRGAVEGNLEQLETLLLESDFGVPVTMRLVAEVERLAKLGKVKTDDEFRRALGDAIAASLRAGNADPALRLPSPGPAIILVVGINGAGKTTAIGKLAHRLRGEGKRVLVGAGDTFRAGAVDQLRVWAERTGADFVAGQSGQDPAAVAWDAVDAAVARQVDVAIIDTAGRLHTSDALMEELRKVARVIPKRLPGAPHETLLVLDGTIGQNAVQQAKQFSAAVPLTGVIVSKLDGTAKGGVVVAVHEAVNVPVKFVGVGEAATDLLPFDAATYAADLVADD